MTVARRRRRGGACAALALLATIGAYAVPASAQNFYQLTNPRIYRADPPTTNPWSHDYGFGGMAFEPIAGDPNGRVLLVWETPGGDTTLYGRGDLLEFTLDFDSPPNSNAGNDVTVISQAINYGWCFAMDYESDERVLMLARPDWGGPSGLYRFVRDTAGAIIGTQKLSTIDLYSYVTGRGVVVWGCFAGQRELNGTVYADTMFLINASTSPSGIFLYDLTDLKLIDADPNASNGNLSANPYIGLQGDTGVTNITTPLDDTCIIAGIDVVGDVAFVLYVKDRNDSRTLSLMQIDLTARQVIADANVTQMLNPARIPPVDHWTWGFTVWPIDNTTVRILVAPRSTGLTSFAAIDGKLATAGTPAVDPAAIFVPSSNGGDPNQPSGGDGGGSTNDGVATVWLCPGFGLTIPAMGMLWAAWFIRRRQMP